MDNNATELLFKILDAELAKDKIEMMKLYRDDIDERTMGNLAAALEVASDCDNIDDLFDEIIQSLSIKAKYETERFR